MILEIIKMSPGIFTGLKGANETLILLHRFNVALKAAVSREGSGTATDRTSFFPMTELCSDIT